MRHVLPRIGLCCALAMLPVVASAADGDAAPAPEVMTIAECVAYALDHNAGIAETAAKVEEYEARLAEVESIFYPKIQAMGYVAPMFSVSGGVTGYQQAWKSPGDWGPYLHLQAQFVQILTTFGQAGKGEEAAQEYALVHAAKLAEAELAVALEVKTLAITYQYTQSMKPTLSKATELISSALEETKADYEEGNGEATMADVMKLEYFGAQLAALSLQLESGSALALEALEHTMGMPASEHLVLAQGKLPTEIAPPAASVAELVETAATKRPEWAQLDHGLKAAKALAESKQLSMVPALFLGGTLTADWTPMRDDVDNPYVYDPYNQVVGGVAVGLMWDFDPAKSIAGTEAAEAMGKQVEALAAFAATGIPLRVVKAYEDTTTLAKAAALAKDGVKAARKWMLFAATALETGAGESDDLYDGAAAFLQAKATYYDTLKRYHIAMAELDFAVGIAAE